MRCFRCPHSTPSPVVLFARLGIQRLTTGQQTVHLARWPVAGLLFTATATAVFRPAVLSHPKPDSSLPKPSLGVALMVL